MESGFCHLALEALFPRFCLSCKREGQIFCLECTARWNAVHEPASCPFCHVQGSNRTCEACQKTTFLDGLVSYLPYGNPVVREAIRVWKYDGDQSVEPVLQHWIQQAEDRLWPLMDEFVVTYIPIHTTRRTMRGFDQSANLAGWIAELFGRTVECLLVRSTKTKPQAKQQHVDRRIGLLDGIFQIHPYATELPPRVLICDDVFTSGATMDAAAKCLKEAGVKEVWGFAIGKG